MEYVFIIWRIVFDVVGGSLQRHTMAQPPTSPRKMTLLSKINQISGSPALKGSIYVSIVTSLLLQMLTPRQLTWFGTLRHSPCHVTQAQPMADGLPDWHRLLTTLLVQQHPRPETRVALSLWRRTSSVAWRCQGFTQTRHVAIALKHVLVTL